MRHSVQLAHARSSRRFQRAEPTWFRLSAMLCVLLMVVSACVQASHVHDDGRPTPWKSLQHKIPAHAPGSTPANTPDHCLLCAVMHAAMPSASGAAPVPVQHTQAAMLVTLASRRVHRISFDLFSRPPPSLPTQAAEAGLAGEPLAL